MLPRIVGYYIQVGSVTNAVLAAECEMELIAEKELFSYIENSEREGHFDYYEDRARHGIVFGCKKANCDYCYLLLLNCIQM